MTWAFRLPGDSAADEETVLKAWEERGHARRHDVRRMTDDMVEK